MNFLRQRWQWQIPGFPAYSRAAYSPMVMADTNTLEYSNSQDIPAHTECEMVDALTRWISAAAEEGRDMPYFPCPFSVPSLLESGEKEGQ